MNRKSVLFTVVAIVLVFGFGAALSLVLLWTGPETVPEDKAEAAKIVQTISVIPRTCCVAVTAFGSAVPSRKVIIRPQVTGQVIWQSEAVIEGGVVKEGDALIRIDPNDYELTLAEMRADLEQARFEREVESGRQVIAKREWNELRPDLNMKEVNQSLVLREPHLRRAEAMLEKAQNDIKKAELQLARTVITAPFNAMVVEESVEVGQLLDPGSHVCELVGSDEFWIEVTVPFSQLRWVRFPDANEPGAGARVVLDAGEDEAATWNGRVLRLLGDLDPLARMARLVVSVSDPLKLQARSDDNLPLLLGSYVKVEIDAGELENAIRIPRVALREGNRIWVVGDDRRLQILPATVLWREKETVLIANNLEDGQQLVVSDLRVALPGMEVDPQPAVTYSKQTSDETPVEN